MYTKSQEWQAQIAQTGVRQTKEAMLELVAIIDGTRGSMIGCVDTVHAG